MEKRITYQHKNKTANTVTDFAELLSRQIPQKIQQSSLVPSPLDLSVRGRVRERSLIKNEITTRSSKPVFADLWSILIPQKTQQSSPTPSPLERAGVRLPAPSPLERVGERLPVPFFGEGQGEASSGEAPIPETLHCARRFRQQTRTRGCCHHLQKFFAQQLPGCVFPCE